ncbi:MAG: DUF1223 domain-containing protein [Magnetospiraceae bacterium]
MRKIVALAFIFCAACVSPALAADGAKKVVVELFTSQGCAACPQADAFLGELAQRHDVLPLSLHVTYWDYVGWQDPFAQTAFTERQQAYAKALGERTVYTPQLVVAGTDHVIGSEREAVRALIDKASATGDLFPPLVLDRKADMLRVTLGPAAEPQPARADVMLVAYSQRKETVIDRGENRGRTIVNTNVVRNLTQLGQWEGAETSFRVNLEDVAADADAVAVFIQRASLGPVLGAVVLDLAR